MSFDMFLYGTEPGPLKVTIPWLKIFGQVRDLSSGDNASLFIPDLVQLEVVKKKTRKNDPVSEVTASRLRDELGSYIPWISDGAGHLIELKTENTS